MPGFELFGEKERQSVQEVLETGVLMRYGFDPMRQGVWKSRELEAALSQRMEVPHVHLVSSGTAALTVALASAGVGAGDEVIMPTFTFVASFEAVIALGAIPVLCDIDETLTLDPEAVASLINAKTRAIMVVHMCGSMANLRRLKTLANQHDLILLEDACQAIGGSYEGKPLGSYGDVGCFSFDFVKTITCGEGGALITHSREIYEKAHAYSDHGHDHLGNDRGVEEHPFLGYNYRISELHAAVGLAQLSKLDRFISIQKKNYSLIKEALKEIPGLEFRKVPEGGEENFSFLNIYLPTEALAREARNAIVQTGVDGVFYWYDNNWHYHRRWDHLKKGISSAPLAAEFKNRLRELNDRDFPKSDHWMGRNLSLLIKLGWDEQELEDRTLKLVYALKKVLGE